jgi:hypothetical protein
VAISALPGLIFTYMWALNEARDKSYIDHLAKKFSDRNGTVYYVELQAHLEVGLKRNKEATRLEQRRRTATW